jgi:hypothetical protein
MIVAIDDVFVVPIPTAMKVVGFAASSTPSLSKCATTFFADSATLRTAGTPSPGVGRA